MAALFVPEISPLEAVLRAALIYLFLLVMFRLIGRHEFADLSPFQLILLLIISESVSDALSAGDNSLVTAVISAGTLLAISVGISYGKFKSEAFRKILSASPLKAIENGKPIR